MIKETFRRLINSEFVQDIRQEFLPEDEYIEVKLKEICRQCPLDNGAGTAQAVDRDKISSCRKRFFGILLESFVGKPGNGETDRLYAYLERCERCLHTGQEDHRA